LQPAGELKKIVDCWKYEKVALSCENFFGGAPGASGVNCVTWSSFFLI
jgi:hypothetical protein